MKILITGSSSGLGRAMRDILAVEHEVIGFDIEDGYDVRFPTRGNLQTLGVNELDVLVNNAGINIIDWLQDVDAADWDRVMDTNARGIFMMSQLCQGMLARSKGTILNIVSNAAHMPMTCSLAYNASKAAAHIMTQQLARELTKTYGITVFGVAPNKLAGTGMSNSIERQVLKTRGWTAEEARAYQLNALVTGEETPPELVADFVSFLLSSKERHKFLSGCVIPYGA